MFSSFQTIFGLILLLLFVFPFSLLFLWPLFMNDKSQYLMNRKKFLLLDYFCFCFGVFYQFLFFYWCCGFLPNSNVLFHFNFYFFFFDLLSLVNACMCNMCVFFFVFVFVFVGVCRCLCVYHFSTWTGSRVVVKMNVRFHLLSYSALVFLQRLIFRSIC